MLPSPWVLSFSAETNFSPILLPTPGNSNSRTFSDSQFRGVRTRMAHKHAASRRPPEAHAYRHQKYWDETNKYFYIHQIRCQAEPTAGQPHFDFVLKGRGFKPRHKPPASYRPYR